MTFNIPSPLKSLLSSFHIYMLTVFLMDCEGNRPGGACQLRFTVTGTVSPSKGSKLMLVDKG